MAEISITGDQRHQAMNRLSAATDAKDACSGADIVIEAVPEDMTLKLDVLKPLLEIAPAEDQLVVRHALTHRRLARAVP